MRQKQRASTTFKAFTTAAILFYPCQLWAEAVLDGTLGGSAGQTFSGNFTITEALGTKNSNNTNLFHSFTTFNVNENETASFTHSTASIENIIARVTGTSDTSVFGTINSDASLWIVNPNGVFVHDDATINVAGSFHAAIGDHIVFEGGDVFGGSTNPADPLLTIVNPEYFGFVQGIRIDGAAQDISAQEFIGDSQTIDNAFVISEDMGVTTIDNIFYTFESFNLGNQSSAVFTSNTTDVNNIFIRNASESSSIVDGKIVDATMGRPTDTAASGGAEFWFVNTNGLIFNQNFNLDIAGGLIVNTADFVRFSCITCVSGSTDLLHSVPQPGESFANLVTPEGIGIGEGSGITGGAIVFEGAKLAPNANNPFQLVAAQPDSNLDGIEIRNSEFTDSASSGTSSIMTWASLGSPGEIDYAEFETSPPDPMAVRGDIVTSIDYSGVLIEDSVVTMTGGDNVARQLIVGDHVRIIDSRLIQTTSASFNNIGGIIVIGENIQVESSDASEEHGIFTNAINAVPGPINLDAIEDITLVDVELVASGVTSAAGDIILRAGKDIVVTASTIRSENNNLADAYDVDRDTEIRLEAGNLITIFDADIVASTNGSRDAGSVSISAKGQLAVTGRGAGQSGIASSSSSEGEAGDVTLSGQVVTLEDTRIATRTASNNASNDRASVTVTSQDVLNLTDTIVTASTEGNSNAGNLNLRGMSFILSGGEVTSTTSSGGDAGAITIEGVNAGESVASISLEQGGDIKAFTTGTGNAGEITIRNSGEFSVLGTATDEAEISLASLAPDSGTSGDLEVVGSTVTIRNGRIVVNTASDTITSAPAQVMVRSTEGDITITDSDIVASTSASRDAGSVTISAEGQLAVTGRAARGIDSSSSGQGGAGNVTLSGQAVTLTDTRIATKTASDNADNDSANITVTSQDALNLTDTIVTASTDGNSDAGNIIFKGDNIRLEGALTSIGAVTTSGGNAGSIGIGAADEVVNNLNVTGGVRITTSTDGANSGAAGEINLFAGALNVADGSEISSETTGSGAAGSITITASQTQLNSGDIGLEGGSVISSASKTHSNGLAANELGDAGSIAITAQNLTLKDNGTQISVSNASTRPGVQSGSAQVNLSVVDALSTNGDLDTGIFASTSGSGAAGDIIITDANNITMTGGQIAASTTSLGDAGEVLIGKEAAPIGTISMVGDADISTSTSSSGDAGNIKIYTTGALSLTANSPGPDILSSSTGSGAAGFIVLDIGSLSVAGGTIATDTDSPNTDDAPADIDIRLNGGDATFSGANAIVSAESTDNAAGGSITFEEVNQLSLAEGAKFLANASGMGSAGDITVFALSAILSDGSSIETDSSSALGGDIDLFVDKELILLRGTISASSFASTIDGNGGSVTLGNENQRMEFGLISNGSTIRANADSGDGGRINIFAEKFFRESGAVIEASSNTGNQGVVEISAPDQDISGAISELDVPLLAGQDLISQACEASRRKNRSSLSEEGQGGMPLSPGDYLPSDLSRLDLPEANNSLVWREPQSNQVAATSARIGSGALSSLTDCELMSYVTP